MSLIQLIIFPVLAGTVIVIICSTASVFVNNYSLAGLLVHRSQLLASVPQLEADLLCTSNELDAFSAEMMELEGIYEERLETLRDLEKQVAFISREKVKLDRDAAMLRDKKVLFGVLVPIFLPSEQ